MYGKFKNELTERLSEHFDVFQVNYILSQMDVIASQYDFIQQERGLIVYENGVPEILKTFIACKKVEGKSMASLQNYLLILKQFFLMVQKPLDKITSNDIRVFLNQYQQMRNISNRTLDQYQTYIKAFFTWCFDEEYLDRNIAKKLKPVKFANKEREPLTQLELEKLRSVCETKRDTSMVEFLYSTGCRVSELCNAKICDIDWQSKEIKVLGKGSKWRTTFLNAKSEFTLKDYLAERDDESEYLFVSERKPYNKLLKDGVDKRFRYLSKKADIGRKITPHVLRHTNATTGLQNGMPVTDVQKILGHERLDTTMVYAKVSLAEVHNNHRKYVI